MKAVLTFLMIFSSGFLFAQNTVDQTTATAGFSFGDHFSRFSWVYIAAFVVLVGVCVAGYFFGWDKKLFGHKTQDDGPQLFI